MYVYDVLHMLCGVHFIIVFVMCCGGDACNTHCCIVRIWVVCCAFVCVCCGVMHDWLLWFVERICCACVHGCCALWCVICMILCHDVAL